MDIKQEPQVGLAEEVIKIASVGRNRVPQSTYIRATADLVEGIKDEYPDAEIQEVKKDKRAEGIAIEATFRKE